MTSLNALLRINAASCLAFGTTFLVLPDRVAASLGQMPPYIILALGLLLLVNGLHLALASLRSKPLLLETLWFSIGDLLWWLATLGLIAAGQWITTPSGVTLSIAVAAGVALLGLGQLMALGRARSGLSAPGHWHRIGVSWLALPLWVKHWLFGLNAVFLAAPIVLPWPEARVVLLAFVAAGPLLLAFALFDGGLSRLMGLGHILPWLPLLLWLVVVRLPGEGDPAALVYTSLLCITLVICLVFDLVDVLRWARGEKAILGVTS